MTWEPSPSSEETLVVRGTVIGGADLLETPAAELLRAATDAATGTRSSGWCCACSTTSRLGLSFDAL